MSLRLLPAFTVDNDDDDDGNFTKWMSSYWGHGSESAHSRERKRSFRRPARTLVDRRASLPTVVRTASIDGCMHVTVFSSQLDAMKLNKLHVATMAPTPSHVKTREEKGEIRPHQRARRSSSDDNSRPKSAMENRIAPIPELTESFERRMCFSDKKIMSLNEDDKLCLICHEDMRQSGGGVQELHCTHRFHKEAARRLEQCRPRSGSEAVACQVRRLSDERRRSADEPIYMEKREEQHTPHRKLSLRKHR